MLFGIGREAVIMDGGADWTLTEVNNQIKNIRPIRKYILHPMYLSDQSFYGFITLFLQGNIAPHPKTCCQATYPSDSCAPWEGDGGHVWCNAGALAGKNAKNA